jgi:thioredoxin 1
MSIPFVTEADFASKTASGRVLIDFFAEWCGPCKRLTPVLEQLTQDPDVVGKVTILKLNIDECGNVCSKFDITSVPTLVLLQDGREINRMVGLRDAASLKAFLLS